MDAWRDLLNDWLLAVPFNFSLFSDFNFDAKVGPFLTIFSTILAVAILSQEEQWWQIEGLSATQRTQAKCLVCLLLPQHRWLSSLLDRNFSRLIVDFCIKSISSWTRPCELLISRTTKLLRDWDSPCNTALMGAVHGRGLLARKAFALAVARPQFFVHFDRLFLFHLVFPIFFKSNQSRQLSFGWLLWRFLTSLWPQRGLIWQDREWNRLTQSMQP